MSNWLLLIISIDLIGFGNSKITQNALYTLMTKMVTKSLDEAKEFTRLTCHRSTGVKMLDGILCPCQIHHSHIELQKKGKNWLQKISNFKERDNSLLSWDREDHPEFKTERQIAQIKRWFQFHFWKITCFCTSRVSCFSRLEHLQQSFSFFILTHAKLYEYSFQYTTETGK